MLKPLDVIQLRVTVDAWDAGTVATVLEAAPDRVLAEVADDDGRTLDVISVPIDAATRIDRDNGAGHLRTFPDVFRRPDASHGTNRRAVADISGHLGTPAGE